MVSVAIHPGLKGKKAMAAIILSISLSLLSIIKSGLALFFTCLKKAHLPFYTLYKIIFMYLYITWDLKRILMHTTRFLKNKDYFISILSYSF